MGEWAPSVNSEPCSLFTAVDDRFLRQEVFYSHVLVLL